MRIALTRLAFTASVWMVDRVHDNSANMRTATEPPAPPRFSHIDVLMVQVSYLANRGHTRCQDASHFSGLEPHLHIVSVTAHDLSESPGAADQLTAFAGLQLDIMNRRAQRHIGKRQRIPGPDFRIHTRLQHVPDLQADRCEDVAFLSISIREKRDSGRAVGIILERRNLGGDSHLVTPEIDGPVQAAMTGPTKTDRRTSIVISAAGPEEK